MFKKALYTLLILVVVTVSIEAKSQADVTDKEVIEAIKGGVSSTKKLLKKVPIDYINSSDDTLLHYAVRFRKRKVVEYLVNQKILISQLGGLFYGTALQEAIYYGHLGIASYLIDKGTTLNIQNKYGETALHIATRKGYLDVVEELLKSGASKRIVDNQGNTPYDLIPNLSWDSRKRLRELLRIEQPLQGEQQKQLKAFDRVFLRMGHTRIETKKNSTINVLHKNRMDKKSNMGLDIDVERPINSF